MYNFIISLLTSFSCTSLKSELPETLSKLDFILIMSVWSSNWLLTRTNCNCFSSIVYVILTKKWFIVVAIATGSFISLPFSDKDILSIGIWSFVTDIRFNRFLEFFSITDNFNINIIEVVLFCLAKEFNAKISFIVIRSLFVVFVFEPRARHYSFS